jgi:ketosteroid isomerase-like protein
MTPATADHPNAVLVRNLYEALGSGDITTFLDLIADDAVFHVGGDSVVAGEHRGKEAIINLGLKVLEETAATYRTELTSVLANDSHAVTLHHWTADRRGQHIEMDNFNVYRFENGLVVERWEFIEDREAHDAFWAP